MLTQQTSPAAAPTARPAPTRLARWGPTLLVTAALAFYFVWSRSAPPLEGWGEDFTAATAQASTDHRNVLVAFYMHGCPPCDLMDRRVLPSGKVRTALASFVPVRLDINSNLDLAERFGVYATPTYAVVDAAGHVLGQRMGYMDPDEFVEFLDSANQPASAQKP